MIGVSLALNHPRLLARRSATSRSTTAPWPRSPLALRRVFRLLPLGRCAPRSCGGPAGADRGGGVRGAPRRSPTRRRFAPSIEAREAVVPRTARDARGRDPADLRRTPARAAEPAARRRTSGSAWRCASGATLPRRRGRHADPPAPVPAAVRAPDAAPYRAFFHAQLRPRAGRPRRASQRAEAAARRVAAYRDSRRLPLPPFADWAAAQPALVTARRSPRRRLPRRRRRRLLGFVPAHGVGAALDGWHAGRASAARRPTSARSSGRRISRSELRRPKAWQASVYSSPR